MALYAMGDFHLAFSVDKSMDIFGEEWIDHEKKIEYNCREMITQDDTLVITGDHSWGRNLSQCEKDLDFIKSLPGRKIMLRGNHDMFWNVNKTNRLNELYKGALLFLQNNFFAYKDYALVGTKGYCYEGKDSLEHYEMVMNRELQRLNTSFLQAKEAGYNKFIVFLHYPPTSIGEKESVFTQMAKEYGAEKVIYSHCHGILRYDDSLKGIIDGVEYKLVSSDYLDFRPELILE